MFSRAAYILSALLILYASFFYYPRWQKSTTEATISFDVSGYYWYLPSLFIYKDIKHQSFKDKVLTQYAPSNTNFQQGMQIDNGNYVMKYSSGMAVMYLPLFLAAHALAPMLGYPPDGFSLPYQFAIQFGGVFMCLLGLWYFRKLLLFYYDDKVVAAVIAILVFGTNYLNVAAIDAGMSHGWLFTLYVFILLNTHYFYKGFGVKYAIRLGLLIGLATLTRPTDSISCIIPLLWGVESISLKAIRERIAMIGAQYRPLLIAVCCAVLVYSVQLVYWKYVSGQWFVYSYKGQEFTWKDPSIFNYTLSYRSGWLTYCPMMVLAFLGILPFIKNGKNKVAILSFFLLNYYIVCAWEIWWYGGRAMVQSYPVLMFPVAALVSWIADKKLLKWLFGLIALLFIYFNVWITVQYHTGKLYDTDSMTKNYFWRVVGRWDAAEHTIFLRDNTELYEQTPKSKKLVYENDFKEDTGAYYTRDTVLGTTSILLSQTQQLSPVYRFAYNGANADWLRVEAEFNCGQKEWEMWRMTQFIVRLTDKNLADDKNIVKENMIRPHRVLGDGEHKKIWVDMKLPKGHYDSVQVFFWNGGGDKEIKISELKVWEFKE